MLIAPVAGTGERHSMRFPLREKAIDVGEQALGVRAGKRSVASEDPDAGRVRQRIKWNRWHRTKDTARASAHAVGAWTGLVCCAVASQFTQGHARALSGDSRADRDRCPRLVAPLGVGRPNGIAAG